MENQIHHAIRLSCNCVHLAPNHHFLPLESDAVRMGKRVLGRHLQIWAHEHCRVSSFQGEMTFCRHTIIEPIGLDRWIPVHIRPVDCSVDEFVITVMLKLRLNDFTASEYCRSRYCADIQTSSGDDFTERAFFSALARDQDSRRAKGGGAYELSNAWAMNNSVLIRRPFPLNKLPAEVRFQIWDWALIQDVAHETVDRSYTATVKAHAEDCSQHKRCRIPLQEASRVLATLRHSLSLNTHMHNEVAQWMYPRTLLTFAYPGELSSALTPFSSHKVKLIRHVGIYIHDFTQQPCGWGTPPHLHQTSLAHNVWPPLARAAAPAYHHDQLRPATQWSDQNLQEPSTAPQTLNDQPRSHTHSCLTVYKFSVPQHLIIRFARDWVFEGIAKVPELQLESLRIVLPSGRNYTAEHLEMVRSLKIWLNDHMTNVGIQKGCKVEAVWKGNGDWQEWPVLQ